MVTKGFLCKSGKWTCVFELIETTTGSRTLGTRVYPHVLPRCILFGASGFSSVAYRLVRANMAVSMKAEAST